MSKKKRRIAYLIIMLVGMVAYWLFIWFLGNDERFDFVPFVIGSTVAFACCGIKYSGNSEAEEWHGNINVTEEHDE